MVLMKGGMEGLATLSPLDIRTRGRSWPDCLPLGSTSGYYPYHRFSI